MNVKPHPPDVPCAGPNAPKCEQVDDLIQLLVTIRHRWGNTTVRYNVQWGGSALWAEDDLRRQVAKLTKQVERLKKRLKLQTGSGGK